jgi:hypothetical protein
MERLNVWFFYQIGFNVGALQSALLSYQKLNHFRWPHILESARGSIQALAEEDKPLLPKSSAAAKDLLGVLVQFSGYLKQDRALNDQELKVMLHEIDTFNSVYHQEIEDSHAFLVTPIGAYSSKQLLECAESHLSTHSQKVINEKQKEDYQAAGMCLALDLYTASGFHAMRTVEAEARIYHKVVTEVDADTATLGALIKGDDRFKGSGLEKQHLKEGGKADSPLGLIISLLSQLTKIYRNPIMHPEMTLDYDTAKMVFDLAAITVSVIVDDGVKRSSEKSKAAGPTI